MDLLDSQCDSAGQFTQVFAVKRVANTQRVVCPERFEIFHFIVYLSACTQKGRRNRSGCVRPFTHEPVWVCMRDRAQVRRIFVKVDEGAWYHRDDIYRWAMAKLLKGCFGGSLIDQYYTLLRDHKYDPDRILEFADLPQFKEHKYRHSVEDFKILIDAIGKPGISF